mmetsp:Transcript_82671/g.208596  ORF Transcript_82671/g.208596 Transcript_82671/m.208596 type:complete len:148 (+) Transcript_82671:2-445(+)
MRRGLHSVSLSGWRNTHHGVLALSLDGELLTGSEGLDWYGVSTELHTCPPLLVWVERSGAHVWRFETVDTRGLGYWMCLERFQVTAVDAETVEPAARRGCPPSLKGCGAATAAMLGSMLGSMVERHRRHRWYGPSMTSYAPSMDRYR